MRKKHGGTEDFNRTKLLNSIIKACDKLPISDTTIEAMALRVEMQLVELHQREVDSTLIGELALKQLYEIDEMAYVRFAAVFRQFTKLSDYTELVEQTTKKQKLKGLGSFNPDDRFAKYLQE